MKRLAKEIIKLLCDDVRHEVGGKVSFIGVYPDLIVVDKTPVILPQVHLVIQLRSIPEPFEKLYATLHTPKAEPVMFEYSLPPNFTAGEDANFAIGIVPFRIADEGSAKIEYRTEKDGRARIVHHFEIKVSR